MLLTGNHARTLDDKGRIQVPADFRAEISGEDKGGGSEGSIVLYVAPGARKGTLSIYTRSGFEALVQRISSHTVDSQDAMDFELFYTQVVRVEMDKQGRMVLPQGLAAARGLEKELILAGQVDHIDVWNASDFAAAVETRFEPQWPHLKGFLRRNSPMPGGNGGQKG